MLQVEAIALLMNRKKAIGNSFQIGRSFVNLGEKGISLFFNRRWTQIHKGCRKGDRPFDQLWAIAFLNY